MLKNTLQKRNWYNKTARVKLNIMKGIFLCAILGICFCSCNQQPARHHRLSERAIVARQDSLKGDLLKTDLAFSQLAEDKGRNAAFEAYADSSAVMLRKFSMPISGKDAIVKMLSQFPDTAVKLSWIPVYSDVARSGELGYTYGTYTLESKMNVRSAGTYCTIWRRSKTNGWKFLLSTGNHGLRRPDDQLAGQ